MENICFENILISYVFGYLKHFRKSKYIQTISTYATFDLFGEAKTVKSNFQAAHPIERVTSSNLFEFQIQFKAPKFSTGLAKPASRMSNNRCVVVIARHLLSSFGLC